VWGLGGGVRDRSDEAEVIVICEDDEEEDDDDDDDDDDGDEDSGAPGLGAPGLGFVSSPICNRFEIVASMCPALLSKTTCNTSFPTVGNMFCSSAIA